MSLRGERFGVTIRCFLATSTNGSLVAQGRTDFQPETFDVDEAKGVGVQVPRRERLHVIKNSEDEPHNRQH